MLNLENQSKRLYYFVIPFLVIAGIIFWGHLRISWPDAALKTTRQYLEDQFPGVQWELAKMTMVGESLGKKWRLEFSSSPKDGRRIQANLLVDRWRPGKVVGKFVFMLSPPQILAGGWNHPTFSERLSVKISGMNFFLIGIFLLILQCYWLYRVYRRGKFRNLDGIILVLLGAALLLTLVVIEVHPAFMIAYPLIFAFLGMVATSGEGERSA